MKNIHLMLGLIFLLIVLVGCERKCADPKVENEIENMTDEVIEYFGLEQPGIDPIVFAPEQISYPNRLNETVHFSGDLKHMFVSVSQDQWNTFKIYYRKFDNGKWSHLALSPFQNGSFSLGFCPATSNYYYVSSDDDIWRTRLLETGDWEPPVKVMDHLLCDSQFYFSFTQDTVLYYAGYDGDDRFIFEAAPVNGQYPNSIEVDHVPDLCDEYPFISPDGSFLLTGNTSPGDLYVLFRQDDGSFGLPEKLPCSSPDHYEWGPTLSPDGKFIFFSRLVSQDYTEANIFWVSSRIIDDMK